MAAVIDSGYEPLYVATIFVLFLAFVELAGEFVERFAEGAAHRVPPLDLGLRRHGRRYSGECGGQRARRGCLANLR